MATISQNTITIYKQFKTTIEERANVARSLNFKSEELILKNDIDWIKEIIILLEVIDSNIKNDIK